MQRWPGNVIAQVQAAAVYQAEIYQQPDSFETGAESTFDSWQIQAASWHHAGLTYIAIRGTDEQFDVLRNIPAGTLQVLANGWQWTGFIGYITAAQRLKHWAAAAGRGRNVVLCGHSQGGGIAMELAALLGYDGVPIERVITFGAPRCTSGVRPLEDRIVRVVRRLDPVPMLPANPPWVHVGSEIYLTHEGYPKQRSVVDNLGKLVQGLREIFGRAANVRDASEAAKSAAVRWHSAAGYRAGRYDLLPTQPTVPEGLPAGSEGGVGGPSEGW